MENNIERENFLEEPTTPERPSEAPISDESPKNEQSPAECDEVEKVSDKDNEVEPEAEINSEPEKVTDESNIIKEVPDGISEIEAVSNADHIVACKKCGEELKDGQQFCPKCGQKAGFPVDVSVLSLVINRFKAVINKISGAKNKKKIAVVIFAVVAIAVGVLLIPKFFVSVDNLCAQGNYYKAYSKASEKEKLNVLAENTIAVLSKKTMDNLKNPTSFVLQGGYYDCQYDADKEKFRQQAVLYVYATNGYGEVVGNYWFYAYNFDEDEWELWGSCASLDLDSDDDDYLISIFCKGSMEKEETTVLRKSQISNINTMSQNGTLDNVDLIDVNALDTKKLVELRSH